MIEPDIIRDSRGYFFRNLESKKNMPMPELPATGFRITNQNHRTASFADCIINFRHTHRQN